MDPYKAERDGCEFSRHQMSLFFNKTDTKIQKLRQFTKLFESNPVLRNDHNYFNLTRERQMEFDFKRVAQVIELANKGEIDLSNSEDFEYVFKCSATLIPGGLTYSMFRDVINHLGSKEQIEYYNPLIRGFEIQGCYAQTELGHGSDVSSLETTATFDKENDEFIINSPTITSGKFWPGELGKLATHAVFHAKLVIGEDIYGVQAFICQIRDLDSHRPLKNLEIGDIGPKCGYNNKDNGYMYFRNFRIPRSALLSKFTSVDKNGNFSLKGDPRFAYATMMVTRVGIVESANYNLFRALLIAVRYSIQRKQFKTLEDGKVERSIIDYQTQLSAFVPNLALACSGVFISNRLHELYDRMMDKVNRKHDFGLMKEMHSILSCMKAFYTEHTFSAVKTVREMCGGHGFLQYSGLPAIIEVLAPYATFEGDNFVMYQQTANNLLKTVIKAKRKKSLPGAYGYISEIGTIKDLKLKKFDPSKVEQLLSILRYHSLHYIAQTIGMFSTKKTPINQINKQDLVKVAEAHAVYITAKYFVEGLQKMESDLQTKTNVTQSEKDEQMSLFRALCNVHIANMILKFADGAVLGGYIKAKHLRQTEEFMYEQIDTVRPHMLNMLESAEFPEEGLKTVIGHKDGDLYNKIFEASASNPMNETTVMDSVPQYIKPMSQALSAKL